MRPLTILSALAAFALVGGCADPLEQTTGQEVGSRLERGVTGQGQLTDRDSQREPGDPAAEHGVPTTHP
jgi:hypothetical protein